MKKIIASCLVLTVTSINAVEFETPNWGLERISYNDDTTVSTPYKYNPTNTALNVNVYVLDTGVNFHSQFDNNSASRVVSRRDFSGEVTNSNPIEDCDGHGTYVAGVIGGNTTGVANGVNLHSLKIVNCTTGAVTSKSLSDALQQLIDSESAGVVNISSHITEYKNGYDQSMIDSQISSLINKGFILVAAAGNTNSTSCGYPASNSQVISVGATDINDNRWYVSQDEGSVYGSCVDIFAPGSNVMSANYLYKGDDDDDELTAQSGTSVSAPIVSGIAAQYLSENFLSDATINVISQVGLNSPNKLAYSTFTVPPVNSEAGDLPSVPTNLRATDLCYGDFRVMWSASSGNVSYYEMQKITSSSIWASYQGQSTFVMTSINEDTNVSVKACNNVGCSGFTNSIKLTLRSCE